MKSPSMPTQSCRSRHGGSKPSGIRRHNTAAAFTLVEVTAASAVLIMVICTSLVVLLQGFQAIETARKGSLAAQIMQSEIERVRLMSWNDVTNSAVLPRPATVNIVTLFQIDPKIAQQFTVTRDVVPVFGRETSMVDIILEVTWTGQNGASHARKFTTRYSQKGLNDFYYTIPRA